MKIMDEKGLSGIIKRLLELSMLSGIIVIVCLPIILKWYLGFLYWGTSEKYWFLLPFLYITGLLALLILYETRRIFKTLNRRNPFMMDNVKSLKHIAAASFAIAAAYLVKMFLFNSFLTIIMTMVFIISGLFCIVFSEVFRQAVIVKEENDLTI